MPVGNSAMASTALAMAMGGDAARVLTFHRFLGNIRLHD